MSGFGEVLGSIRLNRVISGFMMVDRKKGSAVNLSLFRMAIASFLYSWRVGLSVALGVAIATAVIVGALLVGDSMRGSLRELTLQRLGKIESILFPGSFFNTDDLIPADVQHASVIFFNKGVIEFRKSSELTRRSGNVQIIGCDFSFWNLDTSLDEIVVSPGENEVVLNHSAAAELGVSVGDLVNVRLPVEQAVPADSPLGRRDSTTEGLPRLTVVQIIPDRGLGRFSLSASQSTPLNIYLSRDTIAQSLDREGQANMILFDQIVSLNALNIDLSTLGMKTSPIRGGWVNAEGEEITVFQYISLTSDSLLIPDSVATRILDTAVGSDAVPQSTYLANAIETLKDDGTVLNSIPYSTITAVDSSPDLPLDYQLDPEQEINGSIPVVLNEWASQQLEASVGDIVKIAYFEPEVENGKEVERSFTAVVTSVVPLTEPDDPYSRRRTAVFRSPRTRYNDPALTPTVPGVTDQDSIADWDLPFKLTRKISKADDEYWNNHRLTPKVFVPLSVGRKYFGSRFGVITSLRFPMVEETSPGDLADQITVALEPVLNDIGWDVIPVKAEQLTAASGTTPFDGLFLSLSFFVIAAAILLIAMLFRLGLIQRMQQYGLLLITGWSPQILLRYVFLEGVFVAVFGVAAGLLLGVCYSIAVLYALRTWWVDAVTVPFLDFYWTYRSLMIGSAAGFLMAIGTLWISAKWLSKARPQYLLSRRSLDDVVGRRVGENAIARLIAILLLGMSLVLGSLGAFSGGQVAAGAFVSSGMCLLISSLISCHSTLARNATAVRRRAKVDLKSTRALALRNISRYPARSTMTVGLIAFAAFLIFSISAFQLRPTDEGTGGFRFIAEASQPIYEDLNDLLVRRQFMGSDAETLDHSAIEMFRIKLGQDASCNNLYQSTRPTVLGVPKSFSQFLIDADLSGFRWAMGRKGNMEKLNWDALAVDAKGTKDDPIPIVLDQNTAMWSLHLMKGIGEVVEFELVPGKAHAFKVVGLLSNSVLQGKLLMGENNFTRLFPEINGYQFFLIACDKSNADVVEGIMEKRFSDLGMDLTEATTVLARLLAVQNTYLRTFQSLGAIGLLLGTFGLGIAQVRSVLERQSEIAILRSIGFSIGRLGVLVVNETMLLLFIGVGLGLLSSILAVLPHAIFEGINPPILEPIAISILMVFIGLAVAVVAVREVAKLPLLDSLRK